MLILRLKYIYGLILKEGVIIKIILLILIFQALIFVLGLKQSTGNLPLYSRIILSLSFVLSSEAIFIFYGSSYSKYISIAAVFSYIGDMVMANVINFKEKRLIGGIIFFFLTHIFLITGYTKMVIEAKGNFIYLILSAVILLTSVTLLWFKFILRTRKDLKLRLGALIYSLTISFMVCSSLNLALQAGFRFFLTFSGSVLFLISDSLIAIGEIAGEKINHIGTKVWVTYFLAQIFIIYSGIL